HHGEGPAEARALARPADRHVDREVLGCRNFIPYSNPAFDAIVAATAREADPVKLKALIDRGIQFLDREIPTIVFASAFATVAWWDNVKGHGTATKGINFWEGMRDEIWWLAK